MTVQPSAPPDTSPECAGGTTPTAAASGGEGSPPPSSSSHSHTSGGVDNGGGRKRRHHHRCSRGGALARRKKKGRLRARRRRRMEELESSAALRCLSGNGCDPNLPPLPPGVDAATSITGGGHPYGVLPYGNVYSSPSGDSVRRRGMGSLGILNDEQILTILGYLDGPDLGGGVVLCGRFLYVAGHARVDLWRDLTLRLLEGDVFDRFDVGGWRDTYISYRLEKRKGRGGGTRHRYTHEPIRMSGIYSDTLYRPWFCSSFSTPDSWLSIDNVARVHVSELTASEFLEKYERPNIPCMIEGATEKWPALKRWNRDYLLDLAGGDAAVTFRATSGAAPLPASFTLRGYLDYCSACSSSRTGTGEESPLYLFDRTFAASVPQLSNDYSDALGETVPFLSPNAEHGHDLFGLLGERRRPDHRWLIVGPTIRSGSAFHIDPNCTHAWNVPVKGRKRWIFYPPGTPPPGVVPSANGDDVALPVSIGEWHLSFWDEHVRRREHTDLKMRPIECTVSPGDLLFVPHGWWHTVLNLDDDDDRDGGRCDYSIALTQNYVSSTNLPDVLRFLRTKKNQISGCRDRVESEGAVGPEELYDEFTAAMRERRPKLLEEAEAISSGGWTCDAWTDSSSSDGGRDDADADAGTGRHECSNPSELMGENKDGEERDSKASMGGGVPTTRRASSDPTCSASAGTSVLSRAKMSRPGLRGATFANGDGDDGSTTGLSGEGAGFSFSFL